MSGGLKVMIRSNTCSVRAEHLAALMGPNVHPGQAEVHEAFAHWGVEYDLTNEEVLALIPLARKYSVKAPGPKIRALWATRTTADEKRIAAEQAAQDDRAVRVLAFWNLAEHPLIIGILNRKRISGQCRKLSPT